MYKYFLSRIYFYMFCLFVFYKSSSFQLKLKPFFHGLSALKLYGHCIFPYYTCLGSQMTIEFFNRNAPTQEVNLYLSNTVVLTPNFIGRFNALFLHSNYRRSGNYLIFDLLPFELQNGKNSGCLHVCLLLPTRQPANCDEWCVVSASKHQIVLSVLKI